MSEMNTTNQAASDAEKHIANIRNLISFPGIPASLKEAVIQVAAAAIAEIQAEKKAIIRSIAIALGMRAWNPEDVPVYAAQVVSERDAAQAELKRAREELAMSAETDTSIRLILARHGITHDDNEPEATLHIVDGVETLSAIVERLKGELETTKVAHAQDWAQRDLMLEQEGRIGKDGLAIGATIPAVRELVAANEKLAAEKAALKEQLRIAESVRDAGLQEYSKLKEQVEKMQERVTDLEEVLELSLYIGAWSAKELAEWEKKRDAVMNWLDAAREGR